MFSEECGNPADLPAAGREGRKESMSDASARPFVDRRGFLKLASAGMLSSTSAGADSTPPNVVLIYCDDLGYGDLGCYDSSLATPEIDRLAREGTRFTSCISANPVCSPSRGALLTGRYPTRIGVPRVFFPADKEGLAKDEQTLADLLKARGYATKCIGKWHLGHTPGYLPTSRGFDEYFGIPYSNDMNPPVLMRNEEIIAQQADQTQITGQYTEEAVQFIKANSRKPFFLYLPHTFPHIPLYASKRFRGKSPDGIYGDVLAELDWSTGEVLKALKDSGIEKNTIVIFSSDNGPWFQGSPGRLRGRKGSTFEGGVRVPLLVRWPRRVPAGRVSNSLVSTMDFVPTLVGLTGAKSPVKQTDGLNIEGLLTGKAEPPNREALLYFDNWNVQAARLGRWKLHVARHNTEAYQAPPADGRVNLRINPELYDLERDPDESFDVADLNPQVVNDIRSRIEKLLPAFPAEVQKAWEETQSRPSFHYTPGFRPQTRDPRAPRGPA